ncbi:MAG: hypothetical protein AAB614_01130 [Patescibacteria group bacterium]
MYNFDFEDNIKWQRVLDLTHAVWKVLDTSIESSILKNKIKDLSSDILTKYTAYISEEDNSHIIITYIDSLVALLSLAQKTSNIREINFLILKNEYKKIRFYISSKLEIKDWNKIDDEVVVKPKIDIQKKDIEKESFVASENIESVKIKDPLDTESKDKLKEQSQIKKPIQSMQEGLTERQDFIMKFFKESKDGKLRLKDIMKNFSNYTSRTIRNDLKGLCNEEFILRSESRGQGSFYYIKKDRI